MGKQQKQEVISRFFAPKPKTSDFFPSPSSQSTPTIPPTKISATVTFSPSKRRLTSQLTSPKNKTPRISRNSASDSLPKNPNPSLHKKFLDKLLEPPQHLLEPSPLSKSNYTPLEQQVVELKAKYTDVLLMVEVGYRYRFFGEDAETAARVLGIYAHMDRNFLTASIPTHRLNFHVRRLVSAGYKVGVVKQTETAAIKAHGSNRLGPFCRGLSALYTKATMEASEDVGGEEEGCGSCNSYLLCVVEKVINLEIFDSEAGNGVDAKIGVIAVEISTGDVKYGEFDDNLMRAGLEAVILSLSPAEFLLGEPLSKQTEKLLLAYAGPASNVRVERSSQDWLGNGGALVEITSLYENTPKDRSAVEVERVMAMPDLAVHALALTIRHLKLFGLERILCLGASFRTLSNNLEMNLSANAIQQLEILKNNSDGTGCGSLLSCMNNTLTIFGSRLLRHWVTHPLLNRNMINARLDAISEIAESMSSCKASESSLSFEQTELYNLISSVLTNLSKLPDVQRGITRIFHRSAKPSEFISVIQAILRAGVKLKQLEVAEGDQDNKVRSILLRKLILTASSSGVIDTAAKLLSSLNNDAAHQNDLNNLFATNDEEFSEVARVRVLVRLAKENLDLLIGSYRKQLRNSKLEFTSVSGVTHLIEVEADVKVPSDWVKVNSTKKTIRYHPPQVTSALDELSLANEQLTVVCREAWDKFLKLFGQYYSEFQVAVQALAALDCLHSLVLLSRNKNYVRPMFIDDNEPLQIRICSGRHPVMEGILEDSFVPNDTNLSADGEYCQIITGPNMGGKSCYIRQVALIAIMAQVGSFVPATSAKLPVLDGVHTRMGASDSIQQGRSTFLEEMSEASEILRTCSERSLVIMDELGRGTSTHDGVAIAYATLHYLLEQKRCMVLFVTHYPKVVDIINHFSNSVGAYHVSYLTPRESTEKDENLDCEDVVYLYKLAHGVSERSFGFKVAQLAEIPSSCIRRVIVMAAKLEVAVSNREKTVKRCNKRGDRREKSGLEVRDCCNEVVSNINMAISDDDELQKSCELLMHARSLAINFITR